jgi:hypothetical protein
VVNDTNIGVDKTVAVDFLVEYKDHGVFLLWDTTAPALITMHLISQGEMFEVFFHRKFGRDINRSGKIVM